PNIAHSTIEQKPSHRRVARVAHKCLEWTIGQSWHGPSHVRLTGFLRLTRIQTAHVGSWIASSASGEHKYQGYRPRRSSLHECQQPSATRHPPEDTNMRPIYSLLAQFPLLAVAVLNGHCYGTATGVYKTHGIC